MKRARSLFEDEKMLRMICDRETCGRLCRYYVDNQAFCAEHAKAQALVILLNEEVENDWYGDGPNR